MDEDNVRVAVRIRPQISSELIEQCRVCISVAADEPQVFLGENKSFTYDFVFERESKQDEIFDTCVKGLVDGCLEGFNATILAYGQTGSGKTFTMGTGFEGDVAEEHVGIIPRALNYLFDCMKERVETCKSEDRAPPEFKISAQFLELYNEEMFDLLDPVLDANKARKKGIAIHGDGMGGVFADGASTRVITNVTDALDCLHSGAIGRTTASTAMNVQSSRSHAIFTLIIKQQRIMVNEMDDEDRGDGTEEPRPEFETLTAKFHFVDLAGSERLKRTGATGERAKEGISINCGLLALGNVISALGNKSRKASHVPYRDSKLTRLLQDSLGGNSRTIMIACVSPSDRDFMETLNTLKYANRAREIKNKVSINQDVSSKTIAKLRQEIQRLELELLEFKQGKRVCNNGEVFVNDMYHENHMLLSQIEDLKNRIKVLQSTIDDLNVQLCSLQMEKDTGQWIRYGETDVDLTEIVQQYVKRIKELESKLSIADKTTEQLKRTSRPGSGRLSIGEFDTQSTMQIIEMAKKELEHDKTLFRKRSGMSESVNLDEKKSDEENDGDEDDFSLSASDGEEETDNQSEPAMTEMEEEISQKQKVIEALEKQTSFCNHMKKMYEDKMAIMREKIELVTKERDKALSGITSVGKDSGKDTQIRTKSDKELNETRKELGKLEKMYKEVLRQKSSYESKLTFARTEVAEMKRKKVALVKQLREERAKHKEIEKENQRRLIQLRKDKSKDQYKINKLEQEKRTRDAILQKRMQEISVLKKRNKMSNAVAGRVTNGARKAKLSKDKWVKLEQHITEVAKAKQAQVSLEKEMERYFQARNDTREQLDDAEKKHSVLRRKSMHIQSEDLKELEDVIEDYQYSLNFYNSMIQDCQQRIGEEDTDDAVNNASLEEMLQNCSAYEKDFLLTKFLHMSVNQCMTVAQKEAELEEKELRISVLQRENNVKAQLLEHMMNQTDLNLSTVYSEIENKNLLLGKDSNESSRSTSPVNGISARLEGGSVISRLDKARKKTATTEDLLYNQRELNTTFVKEDTDTLTNPTDKFSVPNPISQRGVLNRVPSVPNTLKNLVNNNNSHNPIISNPYVTSPSLRRRQIIAVTQSPKFDRRNPYNSMPVLTTTRQLSNTSNGDGSPPSSPTATRRNRDNNVFSRLTVGTNINNETRPNRGVIRSKSSRATARSVLLLVELAEGHAKSVLSLDATDSLLFSASKDRTVKVWDLVKGTEIESLEGHPNHVLKVRYDAYCNLVYSVSLSHIKIWDLRQQTCVKTLTSLGGIVSPTALTTDNPISTTGEPLICDICLRDNSNIFYSAVQEKVHIWDLRKPGIIGRLAGGHTAAIMCLEMENQVPGVDRVVTGSKDHYIKVFDVPHDASGTINSVMNLEPPHYDGVECLALSGNTLYSGSRDTCLKKWNLEKGETEKCFNQVHKDWIMCLKYLPDKRTLLSACRGGYIRLWNVASGNPLGVVRAHSVQINDIATNTTRVFTASSSGDIGIWRVTGDPMTCSLDSLYGL